MLPLSFPKTSGSSFLVRPGRKVWPALFIELKFDGMRVLIVDDEKNIGRALTMALESIEHVVTCGSNSATALAELRATSFDVVLLNSTIAIITPRRTRPHGNSRV